MLDQKDDNISVVVFNGLQGLLMVCIVSKRKWATVAPLLLALLPQFSSLTSNPKMI